MHSKRAQVRNSLFTTWPHKFSKQNTHLRTQKIYVLAHPKNAQVHNSQLYFICNAMFSLESGGSGMYCKDSAYSLCITLPAIRQHKHQINRFLAQAFIVKFRKCNSCCGRGKPRVKPLAALWLQKYDYESWNGRN